MLVQNKLTKKYGLAYIGDSYVNVFYDDGSKTYCTKHKFYENFIKIIEKELTLVYIVNDAYFNNKWDADWQAKFLKENGYKVKRSFIYDTIENIIERINHV